MARKLWVPLDTGFLADDKIGNLGEDFGASGPLAVIALLTSAKTQDCGGDVRMTWRGLSRACYCDTEAAKNILAAVAQEGVVKVVEADGTKFHAHFLRWSEWQLKNPTGAERTARWRGKQRDCDGPVTVRDGGVTVRDTTVQNSTEQTEQRKKLPPERHKALDGESKTIKGLFDDWRARCGHPTAKLSHDRTAKVRARLRDGYAPEFIRKAIDGAARAAFVNDRGKKFDDLELICRSGSKLEDFAQRADGNAVVVSLSKAQRKHDELEALKQRFRNEDGDDAA